jgi:hypothetical protein
MYVKTFIWFRSSYIVERILIIIRIIFLWPLCILTGAAYFHVAYYFMKFLLWNLFANFGPGCSIKLVVEQCLPVESWGVWRPKRVAQVYRQQFELKQACVLLDWISVVYFITNTTWWLHKDCYYQICNLQEFDSSEWNWINCKSIPVFILPSLTIE